MNLNFQVKKILSKWPILFLLLMMPVLVLAQQDDKDKKKNPPPPPPKKSDAGNPPKQTPPQHDAPPPHHDPPPNNPPKQAPPNQTPPPHNPPPPNNPPKGDDPNRDRDRGNRPDRNPPNGGQPGQPKPTPTQGGPPPNGGPPANGGKPTGQPVQGGPPNGNGGNPNGRGNPNGGNPNGGNPNRGSNPNGGQPQQGGQPPRGNPPNGGQQFGGQGGNRNREPNHAPVPPPQQVRIHNGNATVIRAGGNTHVTTIRTTNFTINRTDYGRRVVSVRPGGVTVVSIGNNRGFVQRPAARVGFVQRTYVVRGRPYVRVYRSYNYRGIAYVRYVPAYYYSPRFYIWAYNPWVRPVYFGWGWGRRAPWFYGGYFAPAPFYVSASLWLTDYIIAENLRASYEAELDAQGQQYAPPPPDNSAADPNDYNNAEVSPALRQAIADEVQRQLNAEKSAAGNPQAGGDNSSADNSSGDQAPPALAADQRVFVVSAPLQVYDGDQPCSLTAGDVISRVQDSPGDDNAVGVSVLSSKQADCRPGAQPRIQVADLQDMSNDLRAQTDEGLKKLSQDQGKNGLPPAPDVTQTANPNGQGTADPDAVNQLKQQQQDADQTEKEVGSGQGGPGGNVMLMPGAFTKSSAAFAASLPLLWKPSIRFTLPKYF